MKLSAAGPTLPALLEDASRRLLTVLTKPEDVGEALREKIAFEAVDPSELLKEWINALLGLARTQRILAKTCQLRVKEERGLLAARAEILGELFDPQRHHLAEIETCESAETRQTPSGYTAEFHV